MKKLFSLLVITTVLAVIFAMTGCVTASSINGTADTHGLFSGGGAKALVSDGAEQIASYLNIIGLFDTGYTDYVASVNEALAAGKKVTTTKTWYYVMVKHTAYAK
ncbi:MAG: hypothetical protein LBK08_13835 [Treponema sp.]|nr:hypothetical protein [Treponema sp.]